MFVEGKELAAKVGEENVFDFSLGNPATPTPEAISQSIKELIDNMDSIVLHIFVITHDYEFIMSACDEVIEIENGILKSSYLLDDIGVKKLKEFYMITTDSMN